VEEREITIEIKKPEIIVLLIALSVFLFLELQVTFNSPIVFGDEGFHTRMAQYISQELEYPAWQPYEGTKLIKHNFERPPLWNILEGSFLFVFGFSEIIIKFLTPFIAILTGLSVFLLGKRIYGKEVGIIAALITITIPSFVTYSVLFYTDTLFVFYFTLFMLTFFLAIKTERKKFWILSGVFGALSFLTKVPGFTVFPLIVLGFLYQFYKKRGISHLLKNYLLLGLVLILLITPYFIRNLANYGTPSCRFPFFDTSGCAMTFEYETERESPTGIEQAGTGLNLFTMGITNYLNFAYGNIWFVPLVALCGLFVILKKRGDYTLIILSILSFLLLFYYSYSPGSRAEDTSRAMLGAGTTIALICGIYLEKLYKFLKNQKMVALFVFALIILTVYILYNNISSPSHMISSDNMINTSIFLFTSGIYILGAFGLLLTKNYKYALIFSFFGLIIYLSFFGNLVEKLYGFYYFEGGDLKKAIGMVNVKQFSPSFIEACNHIKENTDEDAWLMTIWAHQSSYNTQRKISGFWGYPDSGDIILSGDLNLTLSRLKAHGITHIFIQKFSISTTPVGEKYPISFLQFLENNPESFVNIYENGPSLQDCIQSVQAGGGCDGNVLYEINYEKIS